MDPPLQTFNCHKTFLLSEYFAGQVCADITSDDLFVKCANEYPPPASPGSVTRVVEAPCDGRATETETATDTGESSSTATGGSSSTATGGGSGLCSGWDPAANIDVASSINPPSTTVTVDLDWFDALVNEGSLLPLCDDARFSDKNGPGFEVVDADPGELIYELALRNGDVPKEINGYDLDDYDDVATALADLYYQAGETEYELTIRRANSNVVIDYVLDDGCGLAGC